MLLATLRARAACSPCGEERQQHFSLLANEAEELLRLPSLLPFQIGLAHDDRPDGRVLDLGVGLGDGERVHVEDDVLNGGRALFQGNEPCRFAGRDLRIIRASEPEPFLNTEQQPATEAWGSKLS